MTADTVWPAASVHLPLLCRTSAGWVATRKSIGTKEWTVATINLCLGLGPLKRTGWRSVQCLELWLKGTQQSLVGHAGGILENYTVGSRDLAGEVSEWNRTLLGAELEVMQVLFL